MLKDGGETALIILWACHINMLLSLLLNKVSLFSLEWASKPPPARSVITSVL